MDCEADSTAIKTKRRTSRPKVRSGCTTCKSRRIKCDEGRPECARCRTTGRICQGYKPSHSALVLRTQGPAPFYRSPQVAIADSFPSLQSLALNTSLDFYFHIYMVYVSKAAFPFSATAMANWLFQRALEQPVLAEAILLLSALARTANLLSRGEGTRETNRSMRDLLGLRARLAKSLRQILAAPCRTWSDSTVILITIVLCVEAAQADPEAVEVHLAGLERLIYEVGGLDALSERTISLVYYCDLMRGLQKGLPPVFELSSKWVKKLESDSTVIKTKPIAHPSIGARFFDSPWSRDLPPELLSILHSLQPLISCFEGTEDSNSRSLLLENDHLLLLANRLHSLPRYFLLTPFQDAIRLATLIYLTVRVMRFEGNPCIQNLISALQDSLEHSLSIFTTAAPDLLFWILFVSGIASQGFPSHVWCVESLRASATQLSVRGWNDALTILGGYFFVPRRRNCPAKELWHSVSNGQRM